MIESFPKAFFFNLLIIWNQNVFIHEKKVKIPGLVYQKEKSVLA